MSESFFAENPDRYDFLVTFTNFDWDGGGARGLYWSVANDVEGIGLDQFDFSDFWGSEHLQGYIGGKLLADYIHPDGGLDEELMTDILNHEMGHRWLSRARFGDGGVTSSDLLGRDGSHWS